MEDLGLDGLKNIPPLFRTTLPFRLRCFSSFFLSSFAFFMANRRARTAIRQGCNGKSASLGVWLGHDYDDESQKKRRPRDAAARKPIRYSLY